MMIISKILNPIGLHVPIKKRGVVFFDLIPPVTSPSKQGFRVRLPKSISVYELDFRE